MVSPTRTTVISYGTFDSNDSGVYLHKAHEIDMDERTFKCVYEVVIVGGNSTAVESVVSSMEAALNERHQRFKIVVDGATLYDFHDGVDASVAGSEAAEFIVAEWELVGSHRSSRSRCYRITVTVTRNAVQPGKLGVYEQAISVRTNTTGQRTMRFQAQFTPYTSGGTNETALERYADGTYGFEALASAIQATLGGTWERASPITQQYEEDRRTLSASATYVELIYDQAQGVRDSPNLFGATYDITVDRPSTFGYPGEESARPLTGVAVRFSSAVDKDADLTTEIANVILPYIEDTVSSELSLVDPPIMLKHTLKANPDRSRVGGVVLFLAKEGGSLIEISKSTSDTASTGDRLIPVLDGNKWTRDKHTGPGKWLRVVTIRARVNGTNVEAALQQAEARARAQAEASGQFHFIRWEVNESPVTEIGTLIGGGRFVTTASTRRLIFERGDIRSEASRRLSGGLSSRVGGGAGVAPGEFDGFQERK